MADHSTDHQNRELAKLLICNFVRNNTSLEDLHAGKVPRSAAGDYSDVKVVTPFGEIPWTHLSRISDEEMKRLMIECVDNLYTFLRYQDEAMFVFSAPQWDRPKVDRGLLRSWRFFGRGSTKPHCGTTASPRRRRTPRT